MYRKSTRSRGVVEYGKWFQASLIVLSIVFFGSSVLAQQQQQQERQQQQQRQQQAQDQQQTQQQQDQQRSQAMRQQRTQMQTEKQQQIGDEQIKERIQSILERRNLKDVDIEVEQGVVTLKGQAQSLRASQQAMQLAEGTRGVSKVQNELKVAGAKDIDQKQLQSDVDFTLQREPALRTADAQAKVDKGKVTLEGTVSSWQQKQLAEEAVSNVRGVQQVENKLEVQQAQQGQQGQRQTAQGQQQEGEQIWATDRPQDEQQAQQRQQDERQAAMARGQQGQQDQHSDSHLKNLIQQRVRYDERLQNDNIDVKVENNVAHLSGSVRSPAHLRWAESKAQISGIREVDTSGLQVHQRTSSTSVSQMTQEQIERRSQQRPSDKQVKSYLENEMQANARLSGSDIQVEVSDQKATLKGTVNSLAAKRQAEQIAQTSTGVQEVDNQLKVDFQQRAQARGQQGQQQAREGQQIQMSDEELQQDVERALRTDAVLANADQIDVEVNDGVVTLQGEVQSREQASRAEDIVAYQPGIEGIENELDIQQMAEGAEQMSDQELVEAIESEFFWSWFVDGGDIQVDAQNGRVTLSGEVDSDFSKQAATENAYQAGAREVVNNLEVTDMYDIGAAETQE